MVMEILLLITLIAVAASTLYVAFMVNKRTEQAIAPLTEQAIAPLVDRAARDTASQIETAKGDLKQQVKDIVDQLQRNIADQLQNQREQVKAVEAASQGLREQVQAIGREARQDADAVKHLGEQIGTRQSQFGNDLQQLGGRVAQLSESLAQQSAQIADIHSSLGRTAKQAEISPDIDSLTLAMLEAESHAETKGWGMPPELYALTADTRDGRSTLTPMERKPLPDGSLIEGLASIHWPDDVAGCVLVAELSALPLRGAETAFVDSVPAWQWASTHPDGRPARLAVGVCRDGKHTYGLRIKGEDDVQVRADLAEDLVTALRGTF
jgi:hypothetical protein